MKSTNELKANIKKYILEASLSDVKDVEDDALIFENGLLDSMGLLFLIEFLGESFQVEVSDEELNPKNFESINNIVSFVSNKLSVKV
ncbi:acyl carrier protein [Xanthomarina spongicola]|uniref:Acyl carrier protein n=1 Tax=Xanthomarina spongicola TaxID=570520 RepID=A0A316DPE1_9FLAO|nr:acyl carrier protein [Xanthomarina spongicola]PWK19019.1 acyl carrier protein [Xanthomarina spongicola]